MFNITLFAYTMTNLETLHQLQEMNSKLAHVRESCRKRNLQKVALSESIKAFNIAKGTTPEICPGINPSLSFE
jgi:hypothetical protein